LDLKNDYKCLNCSKLVFNIENFDNKLKFKRNVLIFFSMKAQQTLIFGDNFFKNIAFFDIDSLKMHCFGDNFYF